MGCDIHFYVEKTTEDGWVRAEPQIKNQWFGQWDSEPEFVHESFYDGRNYSLFAMLAGVRNAYDIEPIVEPRGLPDDASDSVRESSEDWGPDGHSHSWLTLRELLNVPWHDNTLTHSGWVTASEFHRWDSFGYDPKSWCQAVTGAYVRKVEVDEMRRLIEANVINPRAEVSWGSPNYYTHISWSQSWEKSAESFMTTLVRMTNLAVREGRSLDDVRAVFWFDN